MRLYETEETPKEFIQSIAPSASRYMTGLTTSKQLLYRGMIDESPDWFSATPRTDRRPLHTDMGGTNLFNQFVEITRGQSHFLYRYRQRSLFLTTDHGTATWYTAKTRSNQQIDERVYYAIPSDNCSFVMYPQIDTMSTLDMIGWQFKSAIQHVMRSYDTGTIDEVYDAFRLNKLSVKDIQREVDALAEDPAVFKQIMDQVKVVNSHTNYLNEFVHGDVAFLVSKLRSRGTPFEIACIGGIVHFIKAKLVDQHTPSVDQWLRSEGQHVARKKGQESSR